MLIDKVTYSSLNFKTSQNINKRQNFKHRFNEKVVAIDEKQAGAIGYAFIGAISPVIAINMLKKGRINKIVNSFKNNDSINEKLKSMWKLLEIENYGQILATTTGGIAGGLFAGLNNSNTKQEKEVKYKEGIFEFLNNMTPTTLVALGTLLLEKTGNSKSIPLKASLIFSSVAGGMYAANKLSNSIYQSTFDKYKPEEEKTKRNFKISDTFVHVDDLISLAVLTKIPFANKLQVDKLLPLIYTRAGYEVGTANSQDFLK